MEGDAPAERGAIQAKPRTSWSPEPTSHELAGAAVVAGSSREPGRGPVRAAAIFRYYGSEGWRLDGIMPPSTRPGIHISSAREPLVVVT